MAAKFIVLSLLVASAYGSGGYSSFSYGVSDPNTGDVKDQHEKRVGDSVVGKYSLLESDGTKRIVEYAANAATGFNAVVRKEPAIGVHPSGPHAPLGGAAHAHGPIAHPGQLAHGPIAPAPLSPLAGAGLLAHPGALAHLGAFAHTGALNHPGAFVHPGALAHPKAPALGHPGAYGHSSALAHYGAIANPGTLAHPGALGHPGTLGHPGAFGHPGAASHSGALSHPGALTHSGAHAHPGAVAHPSAFAHPVASRYPGNQASTGYAGANGYGNPLSGHLGNRGAPSVSHYSHSIVHNAARPYPGPYAGAYNGAYGGAYGGANGGYGAHAQNGAYGSPLGNGAVNPHGGLAHSYSNSAAHPAPLGHGNGAYSAQGLGAGLAW